jgi:DNA processing protein
MSACDDCLRRSWLLAELAGSLETARDRGDRLPAVLALSDDDLIAALGRRREAQLRAGYAGFHAERAREAAARAGVALECRCGERYPSRLLEEPDAPAVLHVRPDAGRLAELLGERAAGIVGARRASPYGLEVARSLARDLAAAGLAVVSGMALGIDSAAHEGALAAGGTVAVLAGGADVPYPPSKRGLYQRIVAAGAVVSELPPGVAPRRWMFPARNRLIAALSDALVVVEAGPRSGSLITAGIACDLGRPVLAVPGRLTSPLAAGPHDLIADGAPIVRGPQDVLDAIYGPGQAPAVPADVVPLDPALRAIAHAVGQGFDTVGALVAAGSSVDGAVAALAELERLGAVVHRPGGRYVLSRPVGPA